MPPKKSSRKTITFTCPSCEEELEIGREKAGKKIRCSECDAVVRVPEDGDSPAKAEPPPAKKDPPPEPPPPPPPPPPPKVEEEDEEGGFYKVIMDTVEAPKLEEVKKKEKPKHKIRIVKKTVADPDEWKSVPHGLMLVFYGVCLWGLAYFFQILPLVLGIFAETEYAAAVKTKLLPEEVGEKVVLDKTSFGIALLVGLGNIGLGKTIWILANVLTLAQIGVCLLGYFICMTAPNYFGIRGQMWGAVSLAGANIFFTLVFRLMPLLGMFAPMMILLFLEISLLDANLDRLDPLLVIWSRSPFWETFFSIMIVICSFLEPILFCIFLRAVALSIKDKDLQEQIMPLLQLGFGQIFAIVAFYVLCVTGTSQVLSSLLKVMYLLWRGFLLLFIIRMASTIFITRTTLLSYITPGEGEEAKDKDEEEDDEDEEDDEEDEDEDDEDEDD